MAKAACHSSLAGVDDGHARAHDRSAEEVVVEEWPTTVEVANGLVLPKMAWSWEASAGVLRS